MNCGCVYVGGKSENGYMIFTRIALVCPQVVVPAAETLEVRLQLARAFQATCTTFGRSLVTIPWWFATLQSHNSYALSLMLGSDSWEHRKPVAVAGELNRTEVLHHDGSCQNDLE